MRTLEMTYYAELGFPLHHLPRPGQPLQDMHITDCVVPLLKGAAGLLNAMAEAKPTESEYEAEENERYALELIKTQVEQALMILKRWQSGHEDAQG